MQIWYKNDYKTLSWFNCAPPPRTHTHKKHTVSNLDSVLKSRDITLPTKVHVVKAMVFPVVMYSSKSWIRKRLSVEELMLSNCDVGKDFWESLAQQVDQTSQSKRKSTLNIHWKGWYWSWNSSTLATWFKELAQQKNSDAEKDSGQKRATENEMVGWYHWLHGHEFEQTPGNSEGQGSLMCCSLWGLRAGHDWVTEQEQQSFDSPDYAPLHGAIKFWERMQTI